MSVGSSLNYYLVQTTSQVVFSIKTFQFPLYNHSCHDLVIEKIENNTFTVFTFLHNYGLSQDQYFEPVRRYKSSKSLM